MLLSALNRRDATIGRLIGLGLILWSVFTSKQPPAWHGRGLVVLVLTLTVCGAWVAWTVWSLEREGATMDVYVMALCGGLLTAACPSSAASAFVFVASTVAAIRTRLMQASAVVVLGIASLGAGTIIYHGGGVTWVAYSLGFCAVALAGFNRRQMLARADQAELLLAQTQRSHEEQLRAARLEESARIARDMHDVLAHSLAGLVIQLEATDALLAQGAQPEEIRERVQRAHGLARDGLRETRRAVGALRGGEAGAPPLEAVSAPAAIRALVAQYEHAIELTLEGDEQRLRGPVGEAVVRVVQEALTNVHKHAAGAEVALAVAITGDAVDVTVQNLALAPVVHASLADSGGGYGLQGMRERAAQLGGTLTAGPAPDGWLVSLHLPLDPAPSSA